MPDFDQQTKMDPDNSQDGFGWKSDHRESCSSHEDVQVWSLGHIHPSWFVTLATTTGGRTEGAMNLDRVRLGLGLGF